MKNLTILIAILFYSIPLASSQAVDPIGIGISNDFIMPGSLAPVGATLPGENNIYYLNGIYYFTYSISGDVMTRYEIDTDNNDVKKGILNIKESISNSYPVVNGGTMYRKLDNTIIKPYQLASISSVNFQYELFQNGIVSLYYTESINDGGTITNLIKRFDIKIKGNTLIIRTYAINPSLSPIGNYAGLSFENSDLTPNPKSIDIPYMKTAAITKVNNNYFYSTYIDWIKSNSNDNPTKLFPLLVDSDSFQNSYRSSYIAGQNNIYPAFDETAYITVSNNIEDTFMRIHRNPSNHRDDLNHRVVLDMHNINYPVLQIMNRVNSAKEILSQLYSYGLSDLLVLLHGGNYLTPNVGVAYPTHWPPFNQYGSLQDLNNLIQTAESYGHIIDVFHFDYNDFFQNSPYWNNYCQGNPPMPNNAANFPIALNPDGSCKLSGWWYSGYQNGNYFYTIAMDKMINYAQQEAPLIENNLDLSAVYIDVSTKASFKELIDYSSSNPNSRTIKDGLQKNMEFNDYIRNVFGGPISGEGGEHAQDTIDTLLAGNIDAVAREIYKREMAPVIPDFELREVKLLMANQGMGPYERWKDNQGTNQWSVPIDFNTFPIDKYRATVIAFGHTGLITDQFLYNDPSGINIIDYIANAVKEYYLFRKLQEEYLSSDVVSILYKNPSGNLVPLSQALKDYSGNVEQSFYNAQIYIEYSNGLKIYVNRHQSSTWQISPQGTTAYLPPNSWYAFNPNTGLLVYSALVDQNGQPNQNGFRVDYVKTSDYIMVDARGSYVPVSFSGFSGQIINTKYIKVVKPNGWTLSQLPDKTFCPPSAPQLISFSSNIINNNTNNIIILYGNNFYLNSTVEVNDTPYPQGYPWTVYLNSQLIAMNIPIGSPVGVYDMEIFNSCNYLQSSTLQLTIQSVSNASAPLVCGASYPLCSGTCPSGQSCQQAGTNCQCAIQQTSPPTTQPPTVVTTPPTVITTPPTLQQPPTTSPPTVDQQKKVIDKIKKKYSWKDYKFELAILLIIVIACVIIIARSLFKGGPKLQYGGK